MNTQRNYRFLEHTSSLCSNCNKKIDSKIILENSSVYLLKFCPEHGEQKELLEEDADYYLNRMIYDKPATISKTQTERKLGCPFDCGLCPEHEQHTCNGLIEITNACDLNCNFCYANSGGKEFLSMEKIAQMLDLFIESEFGSGEILQISGGEPTMHPQIIEIIKLAKSKKIKYILLNTNGLRIAKDENFVKNLSELIGGFEIYLQFDSLDDNVYQNLRGKKLLEIKKKAIDNLIKYKIPTTLVATIKKGVNDHEIGAITDFGLKTDYIRGINFQPLCLSGRVKSPETEERITVSGIIKRISEQTSGMIKKEDFISLPCNVDRVAISYFYKTKEGDFVPIVRSIKIEKYLPFIRNTFKFDPEGILSEVLKGLTSNPKSCCSALDFFVKMKPLVPSDFFLKSQKEKIDFVSKNTFRISITSFLDVYNFDIKSMKKECVHVITPEMKKIPFSAYNMLHRKNAS